MTTFKQIEIGQRFRFNCMFFQKKRMYDGKNAFTVSDDKFEQGRAKFMPDYMSDKYFSNSVEVEPVEDELLADKYGNGKVCYRNDWPASKRPG